MGKQTGGRVPSAAEVPPIPVLLETTGLRVYSPSDPTGAPLVQVPSLALALGERVALTGPSGSGKSSVLRGLVRLNPIRAAAYTVLGLNGLTLPARKLRRLVCLVPQVPTALAGDALENCRSALGFGGPVPTDWAARAEGALHEVGLPTEHWRKPALDLSVGQRMRLALARALVIGPRILLLDEPFSPLDRDARGHMEELLRRWVAEGERGIIAGLHHAEGLDGWRALPLPRTGDQPMPP
ncbi:MAG TPA: ATP-binding cassette domain-containing protein [bacterium]|nr:ATP-binding cassette domain-containing protein [bacterium]